MQINKIQEIVLNALDDLKAQAITTIDVTTLTNIADTFIICTGTSNRHVKSLANHVVEKAKEHDIPILGLEGDDVGEWVLVDLADIVVHIMQPQVREFYQLEKLWGIV